MCESQTFSGVKLLVPGERGRVKRSGTTYGYDKEAFKSLIQGCFEMYAKYLENLLESLKLNLNLGLKPSTLQ